MASAKDDVIDVPKWDVALESLVGDEYRSKGSDLLIDDFNRLAQVHAIRFDDIMETVFKLCIYGRWQYRDTAGRLTPITQQTVDELYVNARLQGKDLRHFTGGWRPQK